MEKLVAGNRFFTALGAVAREDGFRIMVLLRLMLWIPYSLLNCAAPALGVRFRDFALGSALGLAPGVAIEVYLGSTARSIGDMVQDRRRWRGRRGAITIATLAISAVAGCVGIWLVVRYTKRALER